MGNTKGLVPGVDGGTSWIIICLLSGLFFSASLFDCLESIVFIGGGHISFNLTAASFSSFLLAVKNVSYISCIYAAKQKSC